MKKLKKIEDSNKEEKQEEDNSDKKIIVLKGKRTKDVKELKTAIEKLGFREINITKEKMNVKIVERETIKGLPYVYITLDFEPDQIVVEYNLPKEYSKSLREFEITSLLLRVLLLTEGYEVDPQIIYKMIFNVFGSVHDILTRDYILLKSNHDSLREEYKKLKIKFEETEKINQKINKTMLEVESRNKELEEKVKFLESVSEETLKEMIVDWLKTNRGSINVDEFSKIHNLSSGRVEQGLNMLMKDGVIEKVR
ncbi:hypothetical protein KO465_04305 [Candidatus Micrarchaeota archaeon]|nr:hypothetical protein [Candidatus Micrarchaeota archaeon]